MGSHRFFSGGSPDTCMDVGRFKLVFMLFSLWSALTVRIPFAGSMFSLCLLSALIPGGEDASSFRLHLGGACGVLPNQPSSNEFQKGDQAYFIVL